MVFDHPWKLSLSAKFQKFWFQAKISINIVIYTYFIVQSIYESIEIQFSIDGIHRIWPYCLSSWDPKVISGPFCYMSGLSHLTQVKIIIAKIAHISHNCSYSPLSHFPHYRENPILRSQSGLQLTTNYSSRELIESQRGSETSLRGSFYSTQETSLTYLFFTLVRLVSETDFLPLQRLVSQRSKTGQRD